jgi:ATP-dependent 26S proteasome regulatory subunit
VARDGRHGAGKQLIEKRIVLPLVEPDAAAQYGVSPPKAVILFGPPGTGKRVSPRRWRVDSVARLRTRL